MDQAFQALLTWQFLFFCLAIAALTFVFRKIGDFIINNYKFSTIVMKFWTDLMLPILPVLTGSVMALILKKYPYPDNLTTGSSRFIWGLVAGLLSGLVYRIVKSFLNNQVNKQGSAVITAVKDVAAEFVPGNPAELHVEGEKAEVEADAQVKDQE
jgi:hypothetical protein